MPRRVATGVDPKRLAMIVAVLARHAGIAARPGRRLRQRRRRRAHRRARRRPRGRARDRLGGRGACRCARGTAAFGEIGLTGRLRPATQAERRLEECAKLGLAAVVAPAGTPLRGRLRVVQAETLRQAIKAGLDAERAEGERSLSGRARARLHAHALRGRPAPRPEAARRDRDDRARDAAPSGGRRRHPLPRGGADRDRRPARALVPLLGRHPARRAVPAAAPLRAREDGRRDHRRRGGQAARLGERAADAGLDDPVGGDGHPASHGRARREADGRARRLGLAAARDRDDLRRAAPLPARPGRRRAREDEPGARDARDLPPAARAGADAADGARVPERGRARRRARHAPARAR